MVKYLADINFAHTRSETDLAVNIRKATSIGEFFNASVLMSLTLCIYRRVRSQTYALFKDRLQTRQPVQAHKLLGKHVRACIVYTWDHKSSQSFWAGMKVWVDCLSSAGLIQRVVRYLLLMFNEGSQS